MKRSEVEKLLAEEISGNPFMTPEFVAIRVLTVLEELGMSPPEYLPEPEYCEVTGKQLECKPIRKWEKE